MSAEEYEQPPVPAKFDVEDQDFENFTIKFEKNKQEIATTSIDILCTMHGCKTPEELVSQPLPSQGPVKFMGNSEDYQHLPNYETLVLKAVKSNTCARLIFLTYFILPQYFQMKFYEAILEVAIKKEQEALDNIKGLSEINTQWLQNEKNKIDEIKAVQQIIEEVAKSESLSGINQLPLQYKAPAVIDAKKLLMALSLMIAHWESNLKVLQENFAENERKR